MNGHELATGAEPLAPAWQLTRPVERPGARLGPAREWSAAREANAYRSLPNGSVTVGRGGMWNSSLVSTRGSTSRLISALALDVSRPRRCREIPTEARHPRASSSEHRQPMTCIRTLGRLHRFGAGRGGFSRSQLLRHNRNRCCLSIRALDTRHRGCWRAGHAH